MSRGQLRVYLGMAPGVGKTFAMLNEGWRRKQRGNDVVVGYFEDHGRPLTTEQLRDLEVIPRQVIEYRDQLFEEMDVKAIIARGPEVVLVDELAHTNMPWTADSLSPTGLQSTGHQSTGLQSTAPGGWHAKRWEDVEELLAAGIDVVTTVNVQHLESLNDVVERITGVTQRETVPDHVVRSADQIELVDMSPESLRRRMVHGNIYPTDKVDAALANYFRLPNLTALRELALMWTADQVDDDLQMYRKRHGISDTWDTREKIVVALTATPGEEVVIRRAARSASRNKADLVAVHVRRDDGLEHANSDGLDRYVELVSQFGGTYMEVVGSDVAKTLVEVARSQNATQLFMGESDRSRWSELIHGSTVSAAVRYSGSGLDVYVISTKRDHPHPKMAPGRLPRLPRAAGVSGRRQIAAALLAGFGLPIFTVVLTHARGTIGFDSALLVYQLVIVIISLVGGLWPGLVAALGGFGLLDWFFVPPIHRFVIRSNRDVLTLVSFVVVGVAVSSLVDIAARRKADAYRARAEARALARMAGAIADQQNPLPALINDVLATFRLDAASVVVPSPQGWRVEASAGSDAPISPAQGTMSIELSPGSYLVLIGRVLKDEEREVLDAFASQLSAALESRRLQREATDALAQVRANEVRSALLAAVSHDLRTPLASIKTAVTTLLSEHRPETEVDRELLLETVNTETDRLNALVANLLDMSRLRSGALVVERKPVWLEEVVANALGSLSPPPASVTVDISDDVPRVLADPGLLERVIANIVQNAINASPPDREVALVAQAISDHVVLSVIDHGPGIPSEQRGRIFRPFQRLGDSPGGRGVGLGLAVAHGFVEAMGAEIAIGDTDDGGTIMSVTLDQAP